MALLMLEFGRLHDEVVVGGHEAIGMDHDGKAAYCLQIPPVNT
jgi:hemin uptake protein HemP